MHARFVKRLLKLSQGKHAYRRRPVAVKNNDRSCVNGIEVSNFCSNDYLGLSNHPLVIDAAVQATKVSGVGSTGSPYVCGYTDQHLALEEALAEHLQRDKVLLFPSGYMANLGVISALVTRQDHILIDRLSHASLIDAVRTSPAAWRRYQHADMNDLRNKHHSSANGTDFIVTDGVFSMDGDIAPLGALAKFADETRAVLMVDDAHGIGTMGPQGEGSVSVAGLGQTNVPILTGTLGKSLGASGAFLAGPTQLVDAVIQEARTAIYSTSLPIPAVAAALQALEIMRRDSRIIQKLLSNISFFKTLLRQEGLNDPPVNGPIQPVLVGDSEAAVELSHRLLRAGYFVQAIRPPTVPKGTSRLRVTLRATHTQSEISGLVEALKAMIPAQETY